MGRPGGVEGGVIVYGNEVKGGREYIGRGVPKHVLIIPDNSRTWARENGLTVREGYNAFTQSVFTVAQEASRIGGLDYLTIHLASADNIKKRPASEKEDYWKSLEENMLADHLPQLLDNGVRIRVIGRMEGVPDEIRNGFNDLVERSKDNSGLALTFMIGYDKDQEMEDAMNKAKEEYDSSDWNIVKNYLYLPQNGLPDVNAVIRTGKEKRTSGILPYSIANAELLFEECSWPMYGAGKFSKSIGVLTNRTIKEGG